MTISTISEETRQAILRIARTHGVTGVRVFGSVARGDATADSDLDLLIDVGGTPTPWFPGGLVADLEELTGRRVDVVEADSLSKPLQGRILREAVPL